MIYDRKRVKQLKLTTGEEIIAEIVEEDDHDIILRNVLQINLVATQEGNRMWTFKYYMCYQDDPERFILIKLDKVVAVANPMDILIDQYEGAIGEMQYAESGEYSTPEYQTENDRYMEEMETMDDSDKGADVITFPTVHQYIIPPDVMNLLYHLNYILARGFL